MTAAEDSAPVSVEMHDEVPVLTFESGLPGFSDLHRFSISPLEGDFPSFSRMTSLDRPEIAFVVTAPGLFFDDYFVEVDDPHQELLGLKDSSDVVVLVIVTLPRPPAPPTANLLGPIVINRRTLQAAQVVQHHTTLPVAAPFPKDR
jgi:flagellar assembly factor FliW